MNPVAIQYIWQAIRESERSDDLPFLDALRRPLMPQPDRPGAANRVLITTAATEPPQTMTSPPLSRP
jgi:hypothetical protein